MHDKIFAVSDIHGHLTELTTALDAAGFDASNAEHCLLCLGDYFDRGTENKPLLDYLLSLPNTIFLRGNHEDRLLNILTTRTLYPRDMYNGTSITLEEFFGKDCIRDEKLFLRDDDPEIKRLLRFINGTGNYFTYRNYVFTHGWLPFFIDESNDVPYLYDHWQNATPEMWVRAHCGEWYRFYNSPAMLPGKIIVCGHRSACYGHYFDASRDPSDDSIFYGDGLRVLDACTVRSKIVNVLVLE